MQTNIFILLLAAVVFLTVKKRASGSGLDVTFSNELKGVAILMVIFCHVGYFLTPDHTFLYPLSVAGGKGVDLFLLLSGFGLTVSALKYKPGIKEFYLKRLTKIFFPMWVVLIGFLVLDWLLLQRTYSSQVIIQSLLGFFPSADLYKDINSPLWYFTLIFFYYLLFPLIFFKRWPILSAGAFLLVGYFLADLNLPVNASVLGFYKLHYMAFPLGMCLAILMRLKLTLPVIPGLDLLAAKVIFGAAALYAFCSLLYTLAWGEPR